MNKAYLLLGSNQGDREKWFSFALKRLERVGKLIKVSSIYETAAWGLEGQPAFLNMAVVSDTPQSPDELLATIHNIETEAGRQRTLKWGQRTLDIDILLYNNIIVDLPELKIPHPFLHDRRFALVPLAEIAPDYIHPKFHKTIAVLLRQCEDPLKVDIYS